MSALEKMISTCIFWLLVYLLTLFITNKTGVGSNVLKHSLKRLTRMRKLCAKFYDLISSSKFNIKSKSSVLMLNEIIRCQKSFLRILSVYLYDDKTDKDVKEARDYVADISDYCRQALILASEGSNADINDYFKQIEARISSAEVHIKKALEYDIKNEMLKI